MYFCIATKHMHADITKSKLHFKIAGIATIHSTSAELCLESFAVWCTFIHLKKKTPIKCYNPNLLRTRSYSNLRLEKLCNGST